MSEPFDTFRPPPSQPDPWQTVVATDPGDEEELGPRDAAALLEQTTRQAERRFGLQPPYVLFTAAVTTLVAYGAVWLSVRNQHPYTGPSGTALAVLYGVLALWIVFVATFMRRTLGGRSSRRQQQLEGIVFGTIWICVYVFEGALYHVDHDHAVAYGVYVAVAPLIIVGAAAAAYQAGRGNRTQALLAALVVAFGAFAAFAGPSAVWGVVGVGLCTILLASAAAKLWERRAHA
jgi:hypothetical protein